MDGSTAKLCIDHLVYLGFFPHLISHKWRDVFKKNPIGCCQGCGNKIRVTKLISKNLGMKYYSKNYLPEVHWIFNFSLDFNNSESVLECKNYIESLSNSKKKEHLFACCYRCWNIAVYHTKDYFTDSVDNYYKSLYTLNSDYINWNTINFEDIHDEQKRRDKIMFNYEYISTWCIQVGICCETQDGLKYCGKKTGKCIHTNSEMLEAYQHKQLLKKQKQLQDLQSYQPVDISVNDSICIREVITIED